MTISPEYVASKSQFLEFLAGLEADLKENPSEWENPTLDRYLEAMGAWVSSYENCYRNANRPLPAEQDWAFFAKVLSAARIYE